jgi:hypothetical protein
VIAFFGVRLSQAALRASRGPARARTIRILGGLRFRHFLPVPFVAALVVIAALLLVQIPPLDFGWWTALGGEGNPVFGSTERTAGTAFEILIPLVFIALLIPALPLFAEREEQIFRAGAEDWSTPKRILKGVQFGLVHAIIGIPIGVALALSIGGWWFTIAYLRGYRAGGPGEALLESTRAHTAYNATLVTLVLVVLVGAGVEALLA